MSRFFVDESIQVRGGFIVAALVYAQEDLSPVVHEALRAAGLSPGVDEFHSGARRAGQPHLQVLREAMHAAVERVKIAVVVVPADDRPRLGNHILDGLAKIIEANGLQGTLTSICFDENIPFTARNPTVAAFSSRFGVTVELEQDSRNHAGLQVADLVAHTVGIMLLDSLGLVTKIVRVGEEAGYSPDTEMELGFEMWASLRWHFFSGEALARIDEDIAQAMTVPTEDYALFVAPTCPVPIAEAARARFGLMYRGCIH
jgi:Protein of unknown function (DUF3800)